MTNYLQSYNYKHTGGLFHMVWDRNSLNSPNQHIVFVLKTITRKIFLGLHFDEMNLIATV